MYLPADFYPPIFVVVKKKQYFLKFPRKNIRTVIGVLCLFIALYPLEGQQVWPGDVSGNGFVDHQDVLFWAYARNSSGSMRPEASVDFSGQDMPLDSLSAWSDYFPGSDRSLAYADCDGNGMVNDLDLAVIKQNYYLAVGGATNADEFGIGDNPVSSQLVLGNSGTIDATPGEATSIPLSLATQDTQAIELSFVSFQLNYGPELIAESTNGSLLFDLNLDIEGNEWLTETGDGINIFIHHHANLGFSDIVLYMDTPDDYVVGTGAMAEFTIVVEEVVFGLQDINISVPLVLNSKFRRSGYISSQGITLNLAGKPVNANDNALLANTVKVFPNPVNTGVLHAQLTGEAASVIERIELFDQTGRLIMSQQTGARTGQLNANMLPEGLYILKIITDAGVCALQVKATR